MDKSAATQAVKVTDWDAFLAGLHADKLRQVRARLNARVDVLTEFGADGLRMADEITRLRAELDAAQEVVRPFAKAHERWNQIGQTVPEFAVFDYAPRSISVWQAAAEWLARQGVET